MTLRSLNSLLTKKINRIFESDQWYTALSTQIIAMKSQRLSSTIRYLNLKTSNSFLLSTLVKWFTLEQSAPMQIRSMRKTIMLSSTMESLTSACFKMIDQVVSRFLTWKSASKKKRRINKTKRQLTSNWRWRQKLCRPCVIFRRWLKLPFRQLITRL